MKKLFLGSLALAGTLAGPAMAADMPLKAAAPVPYAYNWTGFYIGGNAGAFWGNTSLGFVAAPILTPGFGDFFAFGAGSAVNISAVNSVGSAVVNNSGFTGGGQVGFLWQQGSVVSGIEWDLEAFNPSGSRRAVGNYPGPVGGVPAFPFVFNQSWSGNWLSTLRGRLGFAWDNWLIYGTGGVAAADLGLNASFVDFTTAPPLAQAGLVSNTSFRKVGYGLVGGGGIEYGFGNWSLRAEYLYTEISVANSTFATPTVFAPGITPIGCLRNVGTSFCTTFNYHPRFSESIARIALNYRFGYAAAPAPAMLPSK